jgi:hypothetical protein
VSLDVRSKTKRLESIVCIQSLKALGYHPNAAPDADEVSRAQCAGTRLGYASIRGGEALINVLTVNERPIVSGVKCS